MSSSEPQGCIGGAAGADVCCRRFLFFLSAFFYFFRCLVVLPVVLLLAVRAVACSCYSGYVRVSRDHSFKAARAGKTAAEGLLTLNKAAYGCGGWLRPRWHSRIACPSPSPSGTTSVASASPRTVPPDVRISSANSMHTRRQPSTRRSHRTIPQQSLAQFSGI